MTNDEYLAGMWKGDLISRLDWTVRWRRSREPISSQYTAPSWSWASIGSAILYYDGHGRTYKVKVDIVEVLETLFNPCMATNTGY
jgi:hypothetical protein